MLSKRTPHFFYGYVVVLAAFLMMVFIWGTFYAFGVFFKPLLNDFGWSRSATSGAFSLASFIGGMLGVLMGGLTDKIGPRKVMSICGLMLGLGYLLMSRIGNLWHLYLFFGVLIGTGMSGGFVPLLTTVTRWFVRRRGMMSGIVIAGIGIGSLAVPPAANWLIVHYNWRVAYLILGSVVLGVLVALAQLLKPESPQPEEEGTGTSQKEHVERIPKVEGLTFLEAVRTGQFWLLFTAIWCLGFCVYSTMVHFVAHVIELGVSATLGANMLAAIGGSSIVGKILFGRAIDIIGNKKILMIGFMLIFLAMIWIMPATSVWALYTFASAFGLAYGGCVTAESPIVAQLFGVRFHGFLLGIISFSFTIGGAIGPWLTGYIFDSTGSYQMAFLVFAALSMVGLILISILRPHPLHTEC